LAESAETAIACWRAEVDHYLPLIARVITQTQRRVFDGQTVPAGEKLVSLFEPHADIIVKGRREVQYGHKLNLATGQSGLILDVVIEAGNPADAERMVDAKAQFRSLAEPWADTCTSTGRLMLAVLGGLTDVERDLIRTRTAEGRNRAKLRGKHMGRPAQQEEATRRRAQGATLPELADSYDRSISTMRRARRSRFHHQINELLSSCSPLPDRDISIGEKL
jgi:hypothetical protein